MATTQVVKIFLNREERERSLLPLVLSLSFASRISRADLQKWPAIWLLFLILAVVIAISFWAAFAEHLEVTDSGIRIVSIFRRKRTQFSWHQVTNYVSTSQGHWFFILDGKPLPVYKYEYKKLHKQVLIHNRPSLKGIRAIQNQLPPNESFINRWSFDPAEFFGGKEQLLGFTAAYLFFARVAIAIPSLLVLLLLFVLQELANRISIDEKGITSSSLSSNIFISWEEVEAVFRERRKFTRGFTIIAGAKAIFVPPKLCRNRELVRKLLFSLPEGTLMVNFKGKTPRRPRRRLKWRLPFKRPRQEALQPTFSIRTCGVAANFSQLET